MDVVVCHVASCPGGESVAIFESFKSWQEVERFSRTSGILATYDVMSACLMLSTTPCPSRSQALPASGTGPGAAKFSLTSDGRTGRRTRFGMVGLDFLAIFTPRPLGSPKLCLLHSLPDAMVTRSGSGEGLFCVSGGSCLGGAPWST